jgi:hypothetical protein
MSKFPKRPSPFAGRSREFPFPLVGNMSVNDLAAIAHKGDFLMPQGREVLHFILPREPTCMYLSLGCSV